MFLAMLKTFNFYPLRVRSKTFAAFLLNNMKIIVKSTKTTKNSKINPANGLVELIQYFVNNPANCSPKGFGNLHMLQEYTGSATTGAVLQGIIGNIKDKIDAATAIIKLLFKTLKILGISIFLLELWLRITLDLSF
jgi:hypothetical protein